MVVVFPTPVGPTSTITRGRLKGYIFIDLKGFAHPINDPLLHRIKIVEGVEGKFLFNPFLEAPAKGGRKIVQG